MISASLATQPPTSGSGIVFAGFTLGERIGRGRHSSVFRATRDGQVVAIKVEHQQSQSASAAFLVSAAFLARVSHPNLPRIYEVGEVEGRSFMAMELIEGAPLSHFIQRGLSQKEIVAIALACAEALDRVHAYGLVHRDIKPDNILIDRHNVVKVIDFGLAAQVIKDEETTSGEVVGSFLYAAPEQTGMLKRPIDGRSDLYGLGAVIFHMATGRPVFVAADAGELIRMHGVARPASIADLRPDLSPGLSAIVDRLLNKDPDDRYASCAALAADLRRISELDEALRAGRTPEVGQGDGAERVHEEVPLVGREAELSELRSGVRAALDGRGSFMLVKGEPGSGKSRLVRELVRETQTVDVLTLHGKSSKGDPLPFGLIRQMIAGLCRATRRLEDEERRSAETQLKEAASGNEASLVSLSADLAGLFRYDAGASFRQSQEEFVEDVANFFIRLAGHHKLLVLFIDDVQWLDNTTLQLIRRLAAQVATCNMLVACTSRDDPDSVQGMELFQRESGSALSTRVELTPFGEDDVHRLVTAYLGGCEIDRAVTRQLAHHTNGSPFAVGQYVHAMLEAGLLRPHWGTWRVETKGLERLQLSTDVTALVLQRSERLTGSAKRVLSVAAQIGSHFDSSLLPAACGLSEAEVLSAIVEATRSHLLERGASGDDYAFIHDRVREAFRGRSDDEQTREYNQRLAEALDQVADKSREQQFAVARFYAAGKCEDHWRRVHETNLQAGRAALESFAPNEAFAFLEIAQRAKQYMGETSSFESELLLADACYLTDRLGQAAASLEALRAVTRDRWQLALIGERLARVHLANWRGREAMYEVNVALRHLGRPFPRFLPLRFFNSTWSFLKATVLRILGMGFGTKDPRKRAFFELESALYQAGGLAAIRTNDAIGHVLFDLKMQLPAHRLGPSPELVIAYGSLLSVLGVAHLPSFGKRFRNRAFALAEQLGTRRLRGVVQVYEAWMNLFAGRDREGWEILLDAIGKYGRWLDATTYFMGISSYLPILVVRGRFDAMAPVLRRALQKGDETRLANTGTVTVADALISCMVSVAAASNNAGELARWRQQMEEVRHRNPNEWDLEVFRIQAELFSAYETRDAASLASILRFVEESHDSPRMNMRMGAVVFMQAYVTGAWVRLAEMLAARDGERRTAERLVRRAIRRLAFHMNAQMPIFKTHIEALRGAVAAANGKSRDALRRFARAEDMARRYDVPFVSVEIALQRALIYRRQDNLVAARREAEHAYTLAVSLGWMTKASWITKAWDIGEGDAQTSLSRPSLGARAAGARSTTGSSGGSSAGSAVQLQRQLDALMQVSLASARVIDPDAYARAALSEMVRVFGAERAFLFLTDNGAPLRFAGGRDAAGRDIEAAQYSTTAVQHALDKRAAIIVSGTEEGQILGSESAVAHNIRSIMAAPVMFKERPLGVVYLDNSLAKGVFTHDDLSTLTALSNAIAAASETARAARLEIEQTALKKDLALTGAVQSLLVPVRDAFTSGSLELRGLYQPTNHCGGDWWWYEDRGGGNMVVMVGDVTGHGPAPAMVTAAVAGAYSSLSHYAKNGMQLLSALETIHATLLAICRGQFCMTMSAVEIDTERNTLRWYCAGAPTIFIMRADGRIEPVTARGLALGSGEFNVGVTEVDFGSQDRLLVFTDGVSELKLPSGRQLGLKRIQKLLAESRRLPVKAACESFHAQIEALRGSVPLEDDVTVVFVDRLGTRAKTD